MNNQGNSNPRCSIFVITHKKVDEVNAKDYKYLLVGAKKNNTFSNNYNLDDSGENISDYNDSYCELTGLYWMWKNCKDDYIGLVHYRRLFAHIKPHIKLIGRYIVCSTKNSFSLLSSEEARRILQTRELIVKRSEKRIRNTKKLFTEQIGEELFCEIKSVLEKKHPEYMDVFYKVCKRHTHINCNMFVGRKNVIDAYCDWLFPLLQELDSDNEFKTGSRFHNRELGYVAELLFGIWIEHNAINYETMDTVFAGDGMNVNSIIPIRQLLQFVLEKTKSRFTYENK